MTKFKSLALAALFMFSALPAQADENAARQIITSQLESFIAGDYETAYTNASPTIKSIFPTLDRFMSMVKQGYDPVLRPGNYSFARTENLSDTRIVQEVLIRGPDGTDWTAIYFMQLQEDGTWKVDGVNLSSGAAGLT
ncbi:MAG: DUF4864 domain-containing protein [Pseudomonadota bacterium]